MNLESWYRRLRPGAHPVVALVVAVLVAAAGLAVVGATPAQEADDSPPVPFARNSGRDITGLPATQYISLVRSFVSDVWSDGETMYVLYARVGPGWEEVEAYDLATGARKPSKDFDTPQQVRNFFAYGLWSDGEVFWVLDERKSLFFAYSALDDDYGEYLREREYQRFRMPGIDDTARANGVWSNGEVVWVALRSWSKIVAFDYHRGARLPEHDLTGLGAAGNSRPAGLWSDGSTMWVSDYEDAKVYAYDLASGHRQPDLEFHTLDAAGNDRPTGLWSDGEIMWVADEIDTTLYAYNMPTAPKLATLAVSEAKHIERAAENAFSGRVARDASSVTVTATAHDSSDAVAYSGTDADSDVPGHQWSLGVGANSMQVTLTDGSDATSTKVYTLSVERVDAADAGDDAALASMTVNGSPVGAPSSPYEVWATTVAYDVESLTVAATAADAAATVAITPADVDAAAPGHQVRLVEETAWAVVGVVAADGAAERTFRLRIDREPSPWQSAPARNFAADPSHGHDVDALWSDGTTMWVSQNTRAGTASIRGYDLRTGARAADKDIAASQNLWIEGIWSDGETLWTADMRLVRAIAYSLREDDYGAYLADKSFDFGNELIGEGIPPDRRLYGDEARGLWSDGEIMWVGSWDEAKLYAFDLDTHQRAPGRDIDTLAAAGNRYPNGLWSDGETMWVSDSVDRKVYAYDLVSKRRRPQFEIDVLEAAGNDRPAGVWSDGETMWVAGTSFWDYAGYHRLVRVFAVEIPAGARTKWSATMSVGRGSAGGATLWGYSRWTSKGSLSPDRVELGVESTTVQLIGLDSAGDRLYLGLSDRLSDDVTLVVGGTEFALAQAPPTRSAGWTHVWSAPDLDWSAGDEIEVQFVLSASSAEQPTDAVPTDAVTTTLPTPTTTTLPTPTTTLPTPTTTTLPTPKKTPTMALPAMLLTASFADVPASHDGADPFPLRVQFSEAISTSYVNVRDDVFTVTAGEVTRARRVDGRSDLWEITVDPSSGADIVITLSADAECGTPEAVCTSGGLQLSNNPTVTIDGTD